jgi:hypothetical protein
MWESFSEVKQDHFESAIKSDALVSKVLLLLNTRRELAGVLKARVQLLNSIGEKFI